MIEPDPILVPAILRHLRDGTTYEEARRRAEVQRANDKRRRGQK